MGTSKATPAYPVSPLGRRAPVVAPKVYEVLAKNIGLPVSVDDIVKETGLDRERVINGFTTLRARGFQVEGVIKGSLYRLTALAPVPKEAKREVYEVPEPEPVRTPIKRMFEEIGVTRDGVVIIQDDEGTLFKAEEL